MPGFHRGSEGGEASRWSWPKFLVVVPLARNPRSAAFTVECREGRRREHGGREWVMPCAGRWVRNPLRKHAILRTISSALLGGDGRARCQVSPKFQGKQHRGYHHL